MWLLLDADGIVRCMASEECNLHADKLAAGMKAVQAERGGTVGDHYDPQTGKWTPHPENYPQPSATELREAKISAEVRAMAEERLVARGELDA